MIFANVTDITIPEGNVIKIHETNSGKVLWEKKKKELKPKWIEIPWESLSYDWGNIALISRLLQIAFGCDGVGNLEDDHTTYFKAVIHSNHTGRNYATYEGTIGFGPASQYNDGRILLKTVGGSTYGITREGYGSSSNVESSSDIYALSNDGRLAYYYDTLANEYRIRDDFKVGGPGTTVARYIKTNAPMSNDKVFITHSPERSEYLFTGISGGTFVLPESFTKTYSINQNWQTHSKSRWIPSLNIYCAITEKYANNRYVYLSSDGFNWNEIKVFTSGDISDIVYMDKKGLLCAIHKTDAKIATSPDGITWTKIDVPFSNALACAYSPEYDALAVVNNSTAYVSCDLVNWKEIKIPSNAVNFRELIYVKYGIFVGYAYQSLNAWALVLED